MPDSNRREVGDAARGVVGGRVEQRPEQRRAQDRQRLRQRVLDRDDAAASGRSGRGAAGPSSAGSAKLQPAISDRPRRGERVLGAPAHALGVGQPPGGAAPRRQRRRQPVEPVDARDLLDQVDLARHVAAAPVRHAARAGSLVDLEAERDEDLAAALGGHRRAEQPRPRATGAA